MNLNKLSNETLVSIIVSYRSLGINEELSIKAMEELKLRQLNKSDFDYMSSINLKLSEIPKSSKIEDKQFSMINNLFKEFKNGQ